MHNFLSLGPVWKAIGFVVALTLVVVGVWYLSATPAHAPGPVACTADAMQCPDGTWVGRTGPDCTFVCPEASSTATTTPPISGGILPYHSGIRGVISVGPTCPVERMPPDPACADKPYQTPVADFRASDPVHAVALLQSDAQGAFKVSLPPGEYLVDAGQRTLPRCPQTSATVAPGQYASVVISCDTGIR